MPKGSSSSECNVQQLKLFDSLNHSPYVCKWISDEMNPKVKILLRSPEKLPPKTPATKTKENNKRCLESPDSLKFSFHVKSEEDDGSQAIEDSDDSDEEEMKTLATLKAEKAWSRFHDQKNYQHSRKKSSENCSQLNLFASHKSGRIYDQLADQTQPSIDIQVQPSYQETISISSKTKEDDREELVSLSLLKSKMCQLTEKRNLKRKIESQSRMNVLGTSSQKDKENNDKDSIQRYERLFDEWVTIFSSNVNCDENIKEEMCSPTRELNQCLTKSRLLPRTAHCTDVLLDIKGRQAESMADSTSSRKKCLVEQTEQERCPGKSAEQENCIEKLTEHEKCTEQQTVQEKCSEEQTEQEKCPEQQPAQEKRPEEQPAQEKCPEEQTQQEKCPEEQPAQEKYPEEQTEQEKCPEEQTQQEKCPEEQPAQEKYPEEQTEQEKCPEKRIGLEKCPEEQTQLEKCAEEQTQQEKCPEQQTVQGKCSEEQTEQEKCPEEPTEQEKCPEKQKEQEKCADEQTEQDECPEKQTGREKCPEEQTEQEKCADEQTEEEKCPEAQSEPEKCLEKQIGQEKCPDEQPGQGKCPEEQPGQERCPEEQTGQEKCPEEQKEKERCPEKQTGQEKCPEEQSEPEKFSEEHTEQGECPEDQAAGENGTIEQAEGENCTREGTEQIICTEEGIEPEKCTEEQTEQVECTEKPTKQGKHIERETVNSEYTNDQTECKQQYTQKHAEEDHNIEQPVEMEWTETESTGSVVKQHKGVQTAQELTTEKNLSAVRRKRKDRYVEKLRQQTTENNGKDGMRHNKKSMKAGGRANILFSRKRVPFTKAEEENLSKGIMQYGIGNWLKILENFTFHNSRTSTSIKDKYRTMVRQGVLAAKVNVDGNVVVSRSNTCGKVDINSKVTDISSSFGNEDYGKKESNDGKKIEDKCDNSEKTTEDIMEEGSNIDFNAQIEADG